MTRAEKNLEKYKTSVLSFIKRHGREPQAKDFTKTNNLPTARTIQRRYGGLQQFRQELGLSVTNFNTGTSRTKRIAKIVKSSRKLESELFVKLLAQYGENMVSSPAKVFVDSGKTLDFKIHKDNKTYLVDIFHPSTAESLQGCVAIKNKKYNTNEDLFYLGDVEIIFVCTNESLPLNKAYPQFRLMYLSDFMAMFDIE